ncbi:hypothetical protein GT755_00015 [Herbidospora sp. NEAU-GS84]|uniref:Uncharacterized protein n=1 Tax=Herbidospora solisilvae TaxID=2696284 RepID=A0A7C9IZQ4_9ACTN|nr:hypothetical protein [Herbidospora solisilvae]NAS20066.1 hypothetical protein [Herbidospora solisilvae]
MAMGEVAELTGRVVPYITAAADEYGAQVWDTPAETAPVVRAEQAMALFGLRMLDLLVRSELSRPALREAVADVIEDASDDAVAALRLQVKKALSADGQLAADIAALVKDAPITAGAGSQVISNSHIGGNVNQIGSAWDVRIGEDRSTTVHGGNRGIVSTGDGARNVQMNAEASGSGQVYQAGRDQTINER